MRYPWANNVLLILLIAQLVSGVGALLAGAERLQWVIWLHVAGAYAIVVVMVWKLALVAHTMRRRPRLTISRVSFLWLMVLLIGALATGFYWSHSGPHYLGGFSLLTVHGYLAIATLLLSIWHIVAKRFVFRIPAARNRRAFLRLGAIGLAGVLFWRAERSVQAMFALPGAQRRFTGSYETGSFTGRFPQVIWLFDHPPFIDPAHWRLEIDGAVARPLRLSLDELAPLARVTQAALLDCTGGWYTTQEWSGVSLATLLELAGVRDEARSITIESATGYARRFDLDEAGKLLLATHVAGRTLDPGHGFPLRLVAPDRRGFEWVKWVARIEVNTTGAHLQSPLPLQ